MEELSNDGMVLLNSLHFIPELQHFYYDLHCCTWGTGTVRKEEKRPCTGGASCSSETRYNS